MSSPERSTDSASSSPLPAAPITTTPPSSGSHSQHSASSSVESTIPEIADESNDPSLTGNAYDPTRETCTTARTTAPMPNLDRASPSSAPSAPSLYEQTLHFLDVEGSTFADEHGSANAGVPSISFRNRRGQHFRFQHKRGRHRPIGRRHTSREHFHSSACAPRCWDFAALRQRGRYLHRRAPACSVRLNTFWSGQSGRCGSSVAAEIRAFNNRGKWTSPFRHDHLSPGHTVYIVSSLHLRLAADSLRAHQAEHGEGGASGGEDFKQIQSRYFRACAERAGTFITATRHHRH